MQHKLPPRVSPCAHAQGAGPTTSGCLHAHLRDSRANRSAGPLGHVVGAHAVGAPLGGEEQQVVVVVHVHNLQHRTGGSTSRKLLAFTYTKVQPRGGVQVVKWWRSHARPAVPNEGRHQLQSLGRQPQDRRARSRPTTEAHVGCSGRPAATAAQPSPPGCHPGVPLHGSCKGVSLPSCSHATSSTVGPTPPHPPTHLVQAVVILESRTRLACSSQRERVQGGHTQVVLEAPAAVGSLCPKASESRLARTCSHAGMAARAARPRTHAAAPLQRERVCPHALDVAALGVDHQGGCVGDDVLVLQLHLACSGRGQGGGRAAASAGAARVGGLC